MVLLVDPIEMPLTIYQGATFRKSFAWKSGPTAATATPVDLTGCAAALQVRQPRTDDLVATADSLVITPLAGAVTAVFLPATTAAVPVGTYLTDLEITFADGQVRSSQTLTLAVLADYTRP